MFSFIKNSILVRKQKSIKRRYPNVNIALHPDMPLSSATKMVELAMVVDAVNKLEPKINSLSDLDLKSKTEEFSQQVMSKSKQHQSEIKELEELLLSAAIPQEKERMRERLKLAQNKIFSDILVEAFAVVREVSRRTIGMRHFDVQIAGGVVLHEGRIAEMATGEGKTLVATLPAYLNALMKRGVHIVTVNDYLARRDAEWMGPIYEFLGLSVGVIQHDLDDQARKKAYACDITYGTNNEFGFDYLRDNMKYSQEDLVQRPFFYAIVDEVDSILIDEARTPLIISGPAEESTEKYYIADKIVPRLKGRIILERDEIAAKFKGEDLASGYDYILDEKAHTAHLTEEGESKACSMLGVDNLHDIKTMDWRHHIIQALRAHGPNFRRDVDYVIKDGQVIIVDEFTGRLMPGRRWSDGLHQAVEAKEGLKIERENQTLATVTFQNYFRMYDKLAGMTGTAFSEAQEFKAIYQLDVVVVPTNRPLIRSRYSDCVYKTQEEKFSAVVEEIVSLYDKGRPVLVGTISIEKSEYLSEMLKRRGISHQVLNAKYHEQEAQIVAQAGRYKSVTIATNMAGRGTDILLGGNPEYMAKNLLKNKQPPADESNYEGEYRKILEDFKKDTEQEHAKVVGLGGLHVLGTERHEARRIDNQLRGRAGRQGDPGSSRFYVSLEDDLMRLFGSERMIGIMDRLGLEKGQVIEHPWINRSIEMAQRRVEEHNFEIRKQLLEYDNVMNKQREVIYAQRHQILTGDSFSEQILDMLRAVIEGHCGNYLSREKQEAYDLTGLVNTLYLKFGVKINGADLSGLSPEKIQEKAFEILNQAYKEKQERIGPQVMQHFERMVLLQIIDSKWKDHLYAMDDLREGIGLRAIGQRDPLIEYKREAFIMFDQMIATIQEDAIEMLFKIQPVAQERLQGVFRGAAQELLHPEASRFRKTPEQSLDKPPTDSDLLPPVSKSTSTKAYPKVGRNDPCPCGAIDARTGRPIKYKKCHGK
ncbi:MAG: preprotein translocase subunit SecA [Candidatus Omnitrophota bacterium]|jgi:preprotein translocase subunit SecA